MQYFCLSCFIPILMIVVGLIFFKFPPKKINIWVGYKTFSSMKNQKRWDYAQTTCGKFCLVLGIITLIISLVVSLITLTSLNHKITTMILVAIDFISLLSVIPYTEIKLKNKFKNKQKR